MRTARTVRVLTLGGRFGFPRRFSMKLTRVAESMHSFQVIL